MSGDLGSIKDYISSNLPDWDNVGRHADGNINALTGRYVRDNIGKLEHQYDENHKLGGDFAYHSNHLQKEKKRDMN